MKKLIFILIIPFIIFSCEKDDSTSQPLVFGEAGTHQIKTYTLPNYAYTTVYYPSDIASLNKPSPLLFFISGWSSTVTANIYNALFNFIASKGYTIIFTAQGAVANETYALNAFDAFLNADDNKLQNDILAYTDKSKIGVLGHSAGGGLVFTALKYFSDKGYGSNGRFVMAFDPWFAFGMDESDMQGLPSNTNVVLEKFGEGGNNDTDGTDARIPLTLYSLLTSIPDSQKDYYIYDKENAEHLYPYHDSYEQLQGILKPLDALMLYTFSNQSEEVRKVALENGNDNPYNNGNGIQVVLPEYKYPCDGANTLIDYCSIVP